MTPVVPAETLYICTTLAVILLVQPFVLAPIIRTQSVGVPGLVL